MHVARSAEPSHLDRHQRDRLVRPICLGILATLTIWLAGVPAVAWADTSSVHATWLPAFGTGPSPAAGSDVGAGVRYEPPVPGPVVRPFDLPGTAFGAGHRGVDLAVSPFALVRAAADGTVIFAGTVGGTVWVSLAHADGITTSYGPLARVRVGLGEDVTRATPIGILAPGGHGVDGHDHGLHWGARIGGIYVDPIGLLDDAMPRPSLIGDGGWEGVDHAVVAYEPWTGGRLGGMIVAPSPSADRPGFAVPPNPNHLVLVPGLGSDTSTVALEAEHLGYDPRSVTRFSYAGRHDRPGRGDDPRRDQSSQEPEDTWAGTRQAAQRLADQLRAQAIREPGRAVDLVGHSMGGVVLLRYLLEHHDPYDPTLPQIGHVVTIASPLDGSDLASVALALESTIVGEIVGFQQRRGRLGGDQLPIDAPAIDELAVGSDMLWDLAVSWEGAVKAGTAGPLATGTRVLNLGASRDAIVSAARTRQPDTFLHEGAPRHLERDPETGRPVPPPPGSATVNGPTAQIDGQRVVDHRVLPGGHHGVLETEAIREVTWRFLAGQEVVESPGHVARVVGGELADSVRIGVELFGIHGMISKAFRKPERVVPMLPEQGADERDEPG